MAGARPLELGFELIVDNAVEGLIGHLQGKRLAEPLLDRHVAGEARGGREPRLELGENGRGQRFLPGGCPWLFIS
jgi:hypothetical protein